MAVVIKCIVPDKKALDVVRLLKSIALEPPVIDPLDDIPTAHDSAVKSRTPGFSARKCVEDYVASAQGKVSATDLRLHVIKNGFRDRSYSYPLKMLIDKGVLKKTKEPFVYEVKK